MSSAHLGEGPPGSVPTIVSSLQQPALGLDGVGTILFSSAAANDLLGSALTGRRLDEFIVLDRNAWLNDIKAAPSGSFESNLLLAAPHARITVSWLHTAASSTIPGVLLCFLSSSSPPDPDGRRRALNKLSAEITSLKPLPDVLRTVVELMVDIARADHATLTLLDDSGDNWVVKYEHPVASTSLIGQRIPIKGHPIQESILRDQRPVIASSLAEHAILAESPRVAELTNLLGNKSLIVLPMACKGRVIGTLSIDSLRQSRVFSAEEIETYQVVANEAALAIELARLLERTDRIEKQQRVHKEATESLPALGDRVLNELKGLIEFSTASVQLISRGRRTLLAAHGFDKRDANPLLLSPVSLDPLIRTLVSSGDFVVVPSTGASSDWQLIDDTVRVKSWVGVPIQTPGGPVEALITLDHDVDGFYAFLLDPNDDTRQALEAFASTVASELKNALLFDAARHQVHAFALINRVAESAGISMDKRDLLQAISLDITEHLPCDACSIFLLDESRGQNRLLVLNASSPQPDAQCTEVHLPAGLHARQSPVAQAFSSKTAVVINDFAHPDIASRYIRPRELPPFARAVIAVPILSGERPLGVVAASSDSLTATFGEKDAILLETICRHIAVALERDLGLSIVQRVSRDIIRAHNVDNILRQIVIGALELTRTETGVIYLLAGDGPTATITHKFHPGDFDHPEPRLDKPDGLTRTVMDSKRPLEINDTSADSSVNPELRDQFASIYAFPLKLDEARVVGVLFLNGKNSRALTNPERRFVSTLVDHAAIACQRMRLEAMYHALVEQAPDGIVLHKSGLVTLANPAACAMFGVTSPTELEGKEILDLIHWDDRERAKRRMATLQQGEPVNEEQMRILRLGQKEPVDVAVYARTLPGDEEIQVVLHELTRVNTLLGEMHHRVNKALNVVVGMLDDQQRKTPSKSVRHAFDAVRSRIEAMALLQRLLRRQRGIGAIHLQEYINEVIDAVVNSHTSDAVVDPVDLEPKLYLNEDKTQACGIIVAELVSNAMLHGVTTNAKGRIRVSLTSIDGSCQLSVSDDGVGFPSADLDPAGLGLMLVERLVKKTLRGSLARSNAETGGAVIQVGFHY